MPRLNDTKAIVDTPLHSCYGQPLRSKAGERDTYPACPNAGEAITYRREMAGQKQLHGWTEDGKEVYKINRPHPDAGSESLRGAMMVLGKKLK